MRYMNDRSGGSGHISALIVPRVLLAHPATRVAAKTIEIVILLIICPSNSSAHVVRLVIRRRRYEAGQCPEFVNHHDKFVAPAD